MSPRGASAQRDEVEPVNEVVLVGRVTTEPTSKEMPSGDVLVTFRLVVDRPEKDRGPSGRVTVDTIDCVAVSAANRRTALRFQRDDVVSVEGALRRRFWRAGAGATSRVEVLVQRLKRVA